MIKPLGSDIVSQLRSGVAVATYSQCVEELVLNSLDAGATCVAVRIDMTCNKVQVVDNGNGIAADQIQLVGERYSTSKCHQLTDLDNLRYYGYRGEALASIRDIAAILEIESQAKQTGQMHYKIFRNGKLLEKGESRHSRPSIGTTVTALDMFYNLPVRRKGMKSSLEMENIRSRLECIALIHPNASLSLRDEESGTNLLQTHKSSTIVGAFSHLFGASKSRHLKKVESTQGPFKLQGYVSKEGHPNKNLQFIYVNERLVLKTKLHKFVNYLLSKSIIVRKRNRLDERVKGDVDYAVAISSPSRLTDRYGIFVLDITCSLSEYDITLDPAKTLVEFKDWEGILLCLQQGIQAFLDRENLVIGVEKLKQETETRKFNLEGPLVNREASLDNSEEKESNNKTSKDSEVNDLEKGISSEKAESNIHRGNIICALSSTNNLMSKTVKRRNTSNIQSGYEEEETTKETNETENTHSCESNHQAGFLAKSEKADADSFSLTPKRLKFSELSPDTASDYKTCEDSEELIETVEFIASSEELPEIARSCEDSEELPTITRPRKRAQYYVSGTKHCNMPVKENACNASLSPSLLSSDLDETDIVNSLNSNQNNLSASSGFSQSVSSEEIQPGQRTPRVPYSEHKASSPLLKLAESSSSDSICSLGEEKSNCDSCEEQLCLCSSVQPTFGELSGVYDKNCTSTNKQPSGLTPLRKLREKMAARDETMANLTQSTYYRSCLSKPVSLEEKMSGRIAVHNRNSISKHLKEMKNSNKDDCSEVASDGVPRRISTLTELRTINKMKSANGNKRQIRTRIVGLTPLLNIRERLTGFKRPERLQKSKAADICSTPQECIQKDSDISIPAAPKLGCGLYMQNKRSSSHCNSGQKENEKNRTEEHLTLQSVVIKEKNKHEIPFELTENQNIPLQQYEKGVECGEWVKHSHFRGKCDIAANRSHSKAKGRSINSDTTISTMAVRDHLENVSLYEQRILESCDDCDPRRRKNHTMFYEPLVSTATQYPGSCSGTRCFSRNGFAPPREASSTSHPRRILTSDDLLTTLGQWNDTSQNEGVYDEITQNQGEIPIQVTTSPDFLPIETNVRENFRNMNGLWWDSDPTIKMDMQGRHFSHVSREEVDNSDFNCTKTSTAATQQQDSPVNAGSMFQHHISVPQHQHCSSSFGKDPNTVTITSQTPPGTHQSQGFSLSDGCFPESQEKDLYSTTAISSTQPFYVTENTRSDLEDSGGPPTLLSHEHTAKNSSKDIDNFLLPPKISRLCQSDSPRTRDKNANQRFQDIEQNHENTYNTMLGGYIGKGRWDSPKDHQLHLTPPKMTRLNHVENQTPDKTIQVPDSKEDSQNSLHISNSIVRHIGEIATPKKCKQLKQPQEGQSKVMYTSRTPRGSSIENKEKENALSPHCQTIGQGIKTKNYSSVNKARETAHFKQFDKSDYDQCEGADFCHSKADGELILQDGEIVEEQVDAALDKDTFSLLSEKWTCRIDPKSGRTLYVNSVNGNTTFDKPIHKILQETTGAATGFTVVQHHRLLTDNAESFLPSVQAEERNNQAPVSLSPDAQESLSSLWLEHQETQEDENSVKWRNGIDKECHSEISSSDESGTKMSEIQQMLDKWENPVLNNSDQLIPNLNVYGTQRAGIYPLKFTKDMLNRTEVIQQIDNKFIACLVSVNQECPVPNLLVVIDQHAAHERIRLEYLVKENFEDEEQQRIQTSRIDPPETLTLSSDQVRLMKAYRMQFKNIGIHFQSVEGSRNKVQFSKVPACFVGKEVSELKRKRTSVLTDLLESLVIDQLQLLQSTSGGSRSLPRVIHQLLCSQACHGAIKFGDPLTRDECVQVVHQLSRCDLPFQCAHGRPSIMPLLDLDILDKKLASNSIPKKPSLGHLWQRMFFEMNSSEDIECDS